MSKTGTAGRKVARAIGAATIAIVLAAAAGALALSLAARPAEGIGPDTRFTVVKGSSAQEVAADLKSRGYIRSVLAFKIIAKAMGAGSSLKAGTYRIRPGMGAKNILDDLVSGKQALIRVTLPEGLTVAQVGSLLERLGLGPASVFAKAARSPALLDELGIPASAVEGYLFPDTYFFPTGFSAEDGIRSMVKAFRERLAAIPEAASLSPKELHERVILASIVEREYKSPEEAPMMASVFYNRLKIRMALQSCATVVYVITERLGKPHPEVVYDRDLELDDPYNTYAHPGLPPGPISNPGLTSLRAVFYPAAGKYLYFRLVDPSAGKHHFSLSLEEHLDASKLFIKKVGG
jgi:UPF0755 protein